MERVGIGSESQLEEWTHRLFARSGQQLANPKYWTAGGKPKRTPKLNPQIKLARSWRLHLPCIVVVGDHDFAAMCSRHSMEAAGT